MNTDLLTLFDADETKLRGIVAEALSGADDGELFVEHVQAESLTFDNGRMKGGSFNTEQGFGLRAVAGEAVGYAHAGDLSEAALKRAADAVRAVTAGYAGSYAAAPQRTNKVLYSDENPIGAPTFEDKAKLLQQIDSYLRDKDGKVRQVTASIAASWQVVDILRADGHRVRDIRPMTRINISVVVGDGDRQESGSFGTGGRIGFGDFITQDNWRHGADEALRQALVNLEAIDAPAGTMDVVLGSGWPGVMLHEAVGHGLEGDFNRKKTSAFAGLLGQMVAAPGVTVVDDGTIESRRGSITVDDEGTPSAYNVLIENGKLVGYMQDRQNARLMGMKATGNGRRQGYAHTPMPRMTNTYMLGGDKTPEEIIASVKKGVYAVSFGGGQVDITSGKFVFGCTEAYLIENGKVGAPIKGAMLIGNGPDAMKRVSMIGNDMKLDTGIGNCGKGGQWVPVGVGQPHLRMDQVTVGGTKA
ncbi:MULTISPECIES: metalloprotease TldD [Rhizobium]|jgi:TldD protein|uniref:Metalloprotease TldD n=1 Tax=Rhizobium lusitanum TaxID=293958 RepID=A0A1C3U3S8_9HYPH|nr:MULTISPECIES: metalloprotease TldD [Rhizobium]NRP84737.1 Metalloprotease TldD [Ensifer adhaerens]NKJ06899.1 TldD protein [Rhizobium sp. SG741]NKJ37126.1 TldD protein [Rhizobium sp. SG570]NTJ06229.1 metalloprotease TldD [Rhizobium lusitanum]SCB10161.1 microcin-processing peptidase 2. Unknown type peptidase. MEROPS family U62 [Rhizobium lusitanum]